MQMSPTAGRSPAGMLCLLPGAAIYLECADPEYGGFSLELKLDRGFAERTVAQWTQLMRHLAHATVTASGR